MGVSNRSVSDRVVILKIIGDFLLVLLAIVFFIFFVPKLVVFFMPIVLGYVISLVANPIVRFLEERIKIMRKHGSAIVIVCVIAIVSLVVYGAIYMLINQVNNIISELPVFMIKVEQKLDEIITRMDEMIASMPSGIKGYMISIKEGLTSDNSLLNMDGSFKMAKTTIISVTNMFLYMIFTIMSAYYFTAERDSILCRIRLCMPGYMMSNIRMVMHNFKKILGDYLKVQVKIMIILIIVLYLGLSIFGIKYSLLYAIVIGVLDLLPLLGIGAILIPWALGAFILNEVLLGIELLILYLICVTIREVAEPKMFGKSIGLSSYTTFFLLYIGLKLGGVIGVIFAIPIGMIVINLYKAGAFKVLIEDVKYLYYVVGKRRREIEKHIIKENIRDIK